MAVHARTILEHDLSCDLSGPPRTDRGHGAKTSIVQILIDAGPDMSIKDVEDLKAELEVH